MRKLTKEEREEIRKLGEKRTYGCWTCFQHFNTKEEFEEHLEDDHH